MSQWKKNLTVSGECAQDALSQIAARCEWSLRDYEEGSLHESPHYWNGWLAQTLREVLRIVQTAETVTAQIEARLAEYED